MTRVPALDGLRGVACVAVLAYHADVGWARGAFLSLTVFFTLSGYLITSQLLGEREARGEISMRRFWSRRVRRLLPVAALGVVVASVVALVVGVDRGTRGDLTAAMLDVANWRFILEGKSYNDLFSSPSPVHHYWSLAVEAQFYFLFPIVAVLALRRGRSTLAWVAGIGCAVSWAAMAAWWWADQLDLAYYSTISRGGEILAGVVLAVVLPPPARHWPAASRALTAVGVGGLVLLAIGAVFIRIDESGDYVAALPVVAIITVVVISAAIRRGPVQSALALRPLVAMGTWSYSIYVVHWPIFVWLDPTRTGLDDAPLAVLRIAVTMAVAVVVHHLVERPVMRGQPISTRVVRVGLVGGCYGLVVTFVAVVVGSVVVQDDLDADAAEFRSLRVPTALADDAQAPASEAPLVLAFFGDSTAVRTGLGLADWTTDRGEKMLVLGGGVTLGCGIEPPGSRRVGPDGFVEDQTEKCGPAVAAWPQGFRDSGASVAVIQVGPWDTTDRRLPGSDRWQHLGEPDYDATLRALLADTVDGLLRAGAEDVVWLTAPAIHPTRSPGYGLDPGPEADPARMARLNELIAEVGAPRPQVHVVDLAGHIDRLPLEEDAKLRPDGSHFTEDAAREVADWLAPRVLAALGVTLPTPG
ncbi:MAG TPA: acyltransferase family protein [Acidimicrobiales bacterium]|nr:acyltransferase family protein [Acidimicrobiales bacterium]